MQGFKTWGISSGIKGGGRKDLALILSERDAVVAGLFTRNKVRAAPVILDEERIKGGICRAVIINSGNANACTGKRGLKDARDMAKVTAAVLGIEERYVMVSSTGIIGAPLPVEKIRRAIPLLAGKLTHSGWQVMAEAIMTTDTSPKLAMVKRDIEGKKIKLLGVAKGSGMIAPDMATMLAFIATDALIKRAALQRALRDAVSLSFNRITVDGDTSTNDMVLSLANGMAGNRVISGRGEGYRIFHDMLEGLCLELARMIIRDGEGATKFIEIRVKGARSEGEAVSVARTVANSPLVKTAFFGEDMNWGRIMAAVGRSGVDVSPERIDIYIGRIKIVKDGTATGREDRVRGLMKERDLRLTIDLGLGDREALVSTTDLSYDYVKINASYRS